MEQSKIYDLLFGKLMKWKDSIEESERETSFFTAEQEALTELDAELNEKSKKLLNKYVIAVKDKLEYIYYNLNVKILHYGIKLGLDLQNSFEDDD